MGKWLPFVLLLAGCGTAVDSNQISLSIEGVAANAQAAIVQRTSNEALRNEFRLGTLPIHQEVTGTHTVTITDHGPTPKVEFGVVVPKLSSDGYFLVTLEPEEGKEKTTSAAFVNFGAYFPEANAKSIPVRYSGHGDSHGWTLNVTLVAP